MSDLSKSIPEPTLKDLLDLMKRQIMLQLNCHAIGIVQEFNAEEQTIKAKVAYKRKFSQRQDNGKYQTVLQNYPILVDVPVVCLGGGSASMTFPIAKGDECIIMFNDRSIDDWFSSGQVGEVQSLRLHSISDGVALVGVRSLPNVIEEYDTEKAVFQNGGTKLTLGEKASLLNDSQNLFTLLNNLTTELTNLTTQLAALTVTGVTSGGAASGPPANAAAITSIGTNITTIQTQLGELLE